MDESLIDSADETAWYENDQLIQGFLDSYKKSAMTKEDPQTEEPSWVKIMKRSKQMKLLAASGRGIKSD